MEKQFQKFKLKAEFVEAVEGRDLTAEKIEAVCDMNSVRSSPNWLRPGAIACTLSHRLCHERIMNSPDECALVLEDDVIFESEIAEMLNILSTRIRTEEVIMLYFQSFKPVLVSTIGTDEIIGNYRLMGPINFEVLGSSGAYIISRQAARKLHDGCLPLRTVIDAWGDHVKCGYLQNLRVVIPFAAKSAYQPSAVDYYDKNSWQGQLKQFITSRKVFPFHQILQHKRKVNWQKMTHYTLSPKASRFTSK